MDLVSCDSCGVILDSDKLSWPSDLYSKDTGEIIEAVAVWDGDTYVARVACPVCGCDILDE